MSDVSLDLKLSKQTDDGGSETGDVSVRVTAEDGSPASDGSVEVRADDGSFQDERQPGTMGSTTFTGVPVTNLTVIASAPGHEEMAVEVSPDDFGGSTITRGWS